MVRALDGTMWCGVCERSVVRALWRLGQGKRRLALGGEWPRGVMDTALVFGTKDCRLESCQGHFVLGRQLALWPNG